jgi:serine/threonine protein kinase
MVTSICPDREDLRSFHLGLLDEGREIEVLDHLNDCQSCEDTVANLEGTADSLVAAVRHSAGSESSASEDRPALQQALAEIEGLIDSPPSANEVQETASPVSERIRDYELLGTLGEGGMGTVYRARHTRLDRQVALKLLPARRLRDNAAVARFEREMKAIGRLDHPTIVRATDAGDVDGTHFLAMDYVEGIDLSKLVRLVGPLDVASACEIVRQAALGLDYAHQQDLIHRDVKPSNLMLTLRGEVRILDLGLALFGAASEALDELTTVGQLMGTLDYMAPEQGDDSHDVDARADVYSLGATLFKLLTATASYDSPGTRTPLAKMKALATIDAPSVADRREELPTELVTIVDRALLRNVDDRFASANELADSLLPFCEGHVLSDLAECGRDLALREDEKIPQPPTLPPFVQKAEIPASPANVTRADGLDDRHPGVGRRIATWILVPLILLAGIVIWIQTDNGILVVESPEGSIPIEIRTGGKFHRNETLSVGKNELTIRSGTYEIVLPKEYDSLKVEDHVFTLERGGKWVARISKKAPVDKPGTPGGPFTDVTKSAFPTQNRMPPGAIPGIPIATPGMPPGTRAPELPGYPGSSGVPSENPGATTTPGRPNSPGVLVFSGKTFEQWQEAVLTERNPTELEKAVQALCILGRNNRDAEAAATVLQVVDAYPGEIRDETGEAELVASSIKSLRTLNATNIISEIAKATRIGTHNTRSLVLGSLSGGTGYTAKAQPLVRELNNSDEFHQALLDVFTELEPDNRQFAFWVLHNALTSQPPDPRLIPFLKTCIQKSEPDSVTVSAAGRLAELQPPPELADVFLNHLEGTQVTLKELRAAEQRANWGGPPVGLQNQDWWDLEASAWRGLAALGKHGAR